MTDYGGSKTPKNERDYWQTPIEIFNALDREFGFWLDAAASESNALCAHYLTELDDSLNSEWTSCGAIWCNPPYSDIGPWVEKAAEQSRAQSQAVVMLLPADISTGWFISAMQSADELRLITGNGFKAPAENMHPMVEAAIDAVKMACGRMVPKKKALEVFTESSIVAEWYPDNRIHECPPSDERANIRSATPLGFAKAVFLSNAPHLNHKREAA
ncbi:phage N-6-adenine-methyltransferase [Raoultella terrigena]|uniref:phage N-6-adenine-methyltransferase n=5 Tax=Bacteria TaxID=2 RepID=UPI00349FCD9E